MTAYGRAAISTPLGRFSAELQSVNRKHLEINTHLPSEFVRYDAEIKKWIAAAVSRGHINVRIFAVFDENSPVKVIPNLALAKQIRGAWQAIAKELRYELEGPPLFSILAKRGDLLFFEEREENEEGYRKALQEVIEKALNHLLTMKEAEGKALYDDILARFALLGPLIALIGEKAPGATARYRQKLQERLQEVMGERGLEDEERLLKEVCLYAERVDIAEELTRFDSHVKQAVGLLQSGRQGVGKSLDFLLQELNREINTMGAKSSDIEVARTVVEIKSELERIREQIQNVE